MVLNSSVGVVLDKNLFLPQILTEIFFRIDSPKTLILTCSLVCRQWLAVLTSRYFWVAYIEKTFHYKIPLCLRGEETFDLKRFATFFGSNLIKNPCGEKNFDGWTITQDGGDGFIVETPPTGCHGITGMEIKSAFATSFSPDVKHIVIDLHMFGNKLLDNCLLSIVVSDYYTARYDCGCAYFLHVKLLTKEEINDYLKFSMNSQVLFSHVEDITTNTSILRVRSMEQWCDATWQKIEHTFKDYPPGIRYVFFEHGGVDRQFWKGHYGPKMTKASVILQGI